jgi:hypothetical protein
MRRGLIVGAALLFLACAHKPPPPAPPPAPPPPPKGDLLRFDAQRGDQAKRKVKLTIESESAAAQGSAHGASKPIVLQFSFGEEEKVVDVSADGSALIDARLVDAVGQASEGANQKLVDDMALAFDELKVQLKRTPRGEIASLGLFGLRAPLEEPTARQVLNALYGAQRGPLLPEQPVAVGATWKTSVPLAASTGYTGAVQYQYTYAHQDAGIAAITCDGRLDAKRAQGTVAGRLTGKSTAEYRFDVAAGGFVFTGSLGGAGGAVGPCVAGGGGGFV